MARHHASASDPNAAHAPTRILVVDDETEMLANYRRLLTRAGHECLTAEGPAEAEELLVQRRPDLVLTDMIMPSGSGLDVLRLVQRHDPAIPVILVTAFGSIDNAVAAMKNKAADYLTKPFAVEELLGKIQECLSRRLMAEEADPREEGEPDRCCGIIGVSPRIREVLELTRKVARTDVNVLVSGESGTGKELFARAIHRLSGRGQEVFVPVDCASLPENLLESELFGYCKGAFTGAHADKMGLFRFADKGTLFLDEIGEMPIALQSKLLRVLQERRFRPIGGRDETQVDVRVVAATNRDLAQALREKTFRSDLYYRLNVVTLHIPALRERPEDIALLATHFLKQFALDGRLPRRRLSGEAMEFLKAWSWPGNVRELQNVIERSATLVAGETIEARDLPEEIQADGPAREETGGRKQLFAEKGEIVGHFERDYLITLLAENGFNVSQAAQAAGCHRRTLYRMIHRQGLDLDAIQHQRRFFRQTDREDPDNEGLDSEEPPLSQIV